MKIVFLDAKTIGDDIDLSGFDRLGEVVKYGFSTSEQVPERIRDADVIVTATSSGEALFPAEAVKSGCTISAIGNYSPDRTELPPELFSRVDRVYVDDVAAAKAEAGDLLLPLSQGYLRSEQIAGELGQLFLGQIPGRTSAEEILVFKSVGIGIQDLVTSLRVYEAARTVPAGR